jgi:predicted PurR-regulated permease PerM
MTTRRWLLAAAVVLPLLAVRPAGAAAGGRCGFPGPGGTWRPGEVSYEQPPRGRLARLFEAADRHRIPLRTILVTAGVVVATYLAGKLMYLLRDVVLLMLVAGFVAMLLNPVVALVDFLPMIGGALAGIPTVLFAFIAGGPTAGIVTAVVFAVYTQIENHVLNPVVMSKTVRINPLLVFIAVLTGASLGTLIGGIFGGFVAALLAIPTAGALQVLVKEVWQATAPDQPQQTPAPVAEPAEEGSGGK